MELKRRGILAIVISLSSLIVSIVSLYFTFFKTNDTRLSIKMDVTKEAVTYSVVRSHGNYIDLDIDVVHVCHYWDSCVIVRSYPVKINEDKFVSNGILWDIAELILESITTNDNDDVDIKKRIEKIKNIEGEAFVDSLYSITEWRYTDTYLFATYTDGLGRKIEKCFVNSSYVYNDFQYIDYVIINSGFFKEIDVKEIEEPCLFSFFYFENERESEKRWEIFKDECRCLIY